MHSFAIITTLFAAATIAVPTASNDFVARKAATSELQSQAKTVIDAKVAAGCNLLKCLAALAPASATCAAALAEEGINPLVDAACFAAVLNNLENPPAGCNGC